MGNRKKKHQEPRGGIREIEDIGVALKKINS